MALTRAVIAVASVTASLEPDRIGYVRISQFTEMTPIELGDAITRLRQQSGGKLSGFVLDLRDDPGGLVDSAVAVAADFLDGGTVVITHGRDSDDDDTYTALEKGDLIRGTPMAVLINSYSASAAEIVAGALQDRRRATVLGTRSFGKGTVQTLLPLDGHGALRLTTALYLTPSGRSIQGSGITPDIVVPLPEAEREADAVVTHENDLPGALPGDRRARGRAILCRRRRSAHRPRDPGDGEGCSARCRARSRAAPRDRRRRLPAPVTRGRVSPSLRLGCR